MKKAVLLILFVFLSGCAHSTRESRVLGASAKITKPTKDEEAPSQELIDSRKDALNNLYKEHQRIVGDVENKLKSLQDNAENNRSWAFKTGAVGVVATITSGALMMASPANAVAAAILTTTGTGVLSIQNISTSQGYSVDAATRVYKETVSKMTAANDEFSNAFEELQKNIHTPNYTHTWDEKEAVATKALMKLKSATVFVSIPTGSDNDLKVVTKEVEGLKNKVSLE